MFKIAITSLNNFQNGACMVLRVWKETVGLKQHLYCCYFYLTKGDQARNSQGINSSTGINSSIGINSF